MRIRTAARRTALVLTGAATAAAVAVGCVVAAAPHSAPDAAAPSAARQTAVEQLVQARLAVLEGQADRAGRTAQLADEAVLEHDTTANRAAADRAERALATLAAQQTPELDGLLGRLTALGVHVGAPTADGAVVTTAALVGRTKALRAVSFARKQIGDPYVFAAAGPHRYDCSGLTMRSYQAVHVGIGGHSATAQWRTAKRHHRLVSYAHRKPGDLIFYGRPGAVYHVAIYVGHNRMIEAPYPGKRVREVPVRSFQRLSQVGRPA
ncbi:C40 family peptidase [Amnibacterium sp.]|uniref:C40 family peptidase n=1 Tax=Amnibacterium sp. TaxID=1872496 RepID=UPI003F7C0902